jgi:hypothetical protein
MALAAPALALGKPLRGAKGDTLICSENSVAVAIDVFSRTLL